MIMSCWPDVRRQVTNLAAWRYIYRFDGQFGHIERLIGIVIAEETLSERKDVH